MLKRKLLVTLLALASVLGASSAMAGTATGSVLASVTLTSACSLTTNPLAFGSVSGLLGTAPTATTTLAVTCSSGTPFAVALGAGTTSGATTTARLLTSGSATLSYGVYQDSAYTQNWGSTTGVGGDVVNSTGTGAPISFTLYGKIPAGQVVAPGTYTDTITATVSY